MTHLTDERCPHLSCLVYHSNGVCTCDMRKSCPECRSKSVNVPPSAKTPFFNEKNLDSTPHTPSSDWEKEFEELYGEITGMAKALERQGGIILSPVVSEAFFGDIKSFIKSLLTSQSIKHKAEVEKAKLVANIALMKLLVERGSRGDMERLIAEFTEKLLALTNKES